MLSACAGALSTRKNSYRREIRVRELEPAKSEILDKQRTLPRLTWTTLEPEDTIRYGTVPYSKMYCPNDPFVNPNHTPNRSSSRRSARRVRRNRLRPRRYRRFCTSTTVKRSDIAQHESIKERGRALGMRDSLGKCRTVEQAAAAARGQTGRHRSSVLFGHARRGRQRSRKVAKEQVPSAIDGHSERRRRRRCRRSETERRRRFRKLAVRGVCASDVRFFGLDTGFWRGGAEGSSSGSAAFRFRHGDRNALQEVTKAAIGTASIHGPLWRSEEKRL